MITLRKAQDRGGANFGWLQAKHSFSFGSYYDPDNMGFSKLRVINDDKVSPGTGFGMHGHKDMEIITFVTSGLIEHKDSMGNVELLPQGEFQLMSAGKGVQHSEYNGSQSEDLTLLQIWIEPNEFGGQPGYQQKDFGANAGVTAIATPSGEDGTLRIKQDARLSQVILLPNERVELMVDDTRKYYIHQAQGEMQVNERGLQHGDGAKIQQESHLLLENRSTQKALALLFDLPA